jgi:hypothetical protein
MDRFYELSKFASRIAKQAALDPTVANALIGGGLGGLFTGGIGALSGAISPGDSDETVFEDEEKTKPVYKPDGTILKKKKSRGKAALISALQGVGIGGLGGGLLGGALTEINTQHRPLGLLAEYLDFKLRNKKLTGVKPIDNTVNSIADNVGNWAFEHDMNALMSRPRYKQIQDAKSGPFPFLASNPATDYVRSIFSKKSSASGINELARYFLKAAADEIKKEDESEDKEEGQHEPSKYVKIPKNLSKKDLKRLTRVSAAGYKPFTLSYKWANAYGLKNVAIQENLPISEKRKPTEEDERLIRLGESRWLPRIFSSYGTPANELLSSPGKGALLHGLRGAIIGSITGAAAGSAIPDTKPSNILGGALVGGGLGLGAGGLVGYMSRKAKNEGIKDLMLRFPHGATKRDLLSDPVYNRDESDRKLQAIKSLNDLYHYNTYSRPATPFINKQAGLFYRDVTPKKLLMSVNMPLEVNGIGGDSNKYWPVGVVRNKEPRFLTRLFAEDSAKVPEDYVNFAANSIFENIGGSLDHVRGGRKFDKKYNFGEYASLLAAHLLNRNVARDFHTGLKATHEHPDWGGPFLHSKPTKDLVNLGISTAELDKLDPSDAKALNNLIDKKFGKKRKLEESA